MRQPVQVESYLDENGVSRTRQFITYPFSYVANFPALAFQTNATSQVNIEASSEFVWTKTAYMADIAGGVQTDSSRVIPLVDISFTDTGSARQLQAESVPLSAIAGVGELPFIQSQPLILSANSNLTVSVSNTSAATAYNLKVVMIGYKKIYN